MDSTNEVWEQLFENDFNCYCEEIYEYALHVSNIWEQKTLYESWYETVIWDVGYVRVFENL